MYSGYDRNGEWYQLYQIGFGGIPGRPVGDGADGHSLWPAFTNVPNEFLEAYFPLRIAAYETIPDSGGPGAHRGGNGISIAYEFLEPGVVSIHDDRWLTYPWGVNGGAPGARSTKLLRRAADGAEVILPSKCDHVAVEAGDVLAFNTWGGGGWGDPLTRPEETVALDVRRGLVTVEGARRYGVVVTADGSVDGSATQALREQMRRSRPPALVFDKGGDIEDLRARAKAETGLDPPVAPRFPRWVKAPAPRVAAE
jgi:N-methylhydantoinase B